MGNARVLVVHNRYQREGGEDVVVDSEMALLRERGHAVELYCRDNAGIDGMSTVKLVGSAFWSMRTGDDMQRLFAAFRPDIVHVHNTFPLVSPSVYWAAARHGCPVIQTLHNFRLLCPQAMFLREGKVCEDCIGRLPWRGVAHGCYRGSRAQSAVLAGMLTAHRALGTYDSKVTRYIALNRFCRDKFIQGGLPAGRISVKPNFVDVVAPYAERPRADGLFVGRLSPEKGLTLLVQALERVPQLRLDVVGTGPEAAVVDGHARIRPLRALARAQVLERMQRAAFLVMPSLWYETFGMVMLEAFACGLPVIAPRLGAMQEMIDHGRTGLLFEPGSEKALADAMLWAGQHPQEMRCMGINARAEYLAKYTPDQNYEALLAIYARALAERASSPGSHARVADGRSVAIERKLES